MSFSKVICVVDEDVDVQNVGDVAWRLLANLDPERDVSFVKGPIDQLDHGANQALYGGKMCIDGTRKWAEEGYKRDWPEVARHKPETEAKVDAWIAELGLSIGPNAKAESVGAGSTADTQTIARELLSRGVARVIDRFNKRGV